jgi:hypothetical protein
LKILISSTNFGFALGFIEEFIGEEVLRQGSALLHFMEPWSKIYQLQVEFESTG